MTAKAENTPARTSHIVRGYPELRQALEGRVQPPFTESLLRTYKINGTIPSRSVTPKTILFDVDAVVEALLQNNETA